MDHVKFWEAHDSRYRAVVIQGYEVHYKENFEGTKHRYTRLMDRGAGG